jgi:hypothetical protein
MPQDKMQPLNKRPRGRPPTGKGTPIQVRVQPKLLAKLDAWVKKHKVRSRPDAIRRMIEKALG